jgi:maleate isomerase
VLTPHAAAGPEAEWPAMVTEKVTIRTARITARDVRTGEPGSPPTSVEGLRALTAADRLHEAVASFGVGSIMALGHASTSTGYALGHRAEVALVDGLSRRWNVPAASTSAAAVAALRALDVERVAVIHPPWFGAELNELGAVYFRDQGFDVIDAQLADLPPDPSRIRAEDVITWVSEHVTDKCEGLFLGGNGFRSSSAIARLEQQTGRPVVTSNQALLWSLLRQVEVELGVAQGYGSLFDQCGP